MTSDDLPEFSQWAEWSQATPPQAPITWGVYAFRLADLNISRLLGESNLLYIGCTEGRAGTVSRRLNDHLKIRTDGTGIAEDLLRTKHGVGTVQISWHICESSEEAKKLEATLLTKYRSDHIELPPLNRKASGKRILNVERLIREVLVLHKLPASEQNVKRVHDWLQQHRKESVRKSSANGR